MAVGREQVCLPPYHSSFPKIVFLHLGSRICRWGNRSSVSSQMVTLEAVAVPGTDTDFSSRSQGKPKAGNNLPMTVYADS